MRLKDRVAMITGGAGGIGRTTCLTFAKEGAHVGVVDMNGAAAESVSGEVKALGVRSIGIPTDVSDGQSVKSAVTQMLKTYGRIDILMNNAGICTLTRIEDCTEEEWDRMMAINLKGTFLSSQAVIDTMKKQKSGRIINLGSLAGEVGGLVVSASYAASKAGVMCLTKSFARALAEYGITVNSIAPGIVATDMTKDHPDVTNRIPLGYVAEPIEIAHAALFLASEEGRYVTGATLDVNGGIRMA